MNEVGKPHETNFSLFGAKLTITLHALSRWRERAPEGIAAGPDSMLAGYMAHALKHSRPVRLKSARERISKTLRHGADAQYRHNGQVVLVIASGSVVSVYAYEGDRWESATVDSRTYDFSR